MIQLVLVLTILLRPIVNVPLILIAEDVPELKVEFDAELAAEESPIVRTVKLLVPLVISE